MTESERKQLRERIIAAGLKMYWVADHLGIARTTLQRWLSGEIVEPNQKLLFNLLQLVAREEGEQC